MHFAFFAEKFGGCQRGGFASAGVGEEDTLLQPKNQRGPIQTALTLKGFHGGRWRLRTLSFDEDDIVGRANDEMTSPSCNAGTPNHTTMTNNISMSNM